MRSARGCIRSRGPGRWWVSVPGPVDPRTGKRTENGIPVRGSRLDAAVALARLVGGDLPDGTTWEAYYSGVVRPTFGGLSARTRADYERLWDVELRHRIGALKVSETTWRAANDALTEISAPTVQRYAGRFRKKMCNMAIRDGLLASNPVRSIEYAPHRKRPKALVGPDAVRAFMASIEGVKYEPLLLCELGAGLRPEEARALLWEDVSEYVLKGSPYCALDVSKALTTVHGRPLFKDAKNSSSARVAVMGEPFASRVLALSDGRSGPLCPSGRPYDETAPEAWYTAPGTVAHNWKKWCLRNGVPHVTDENLRSSYATLMGEAMVPDSIVAGNMGHSDGTTKGRHYQTVTMRAKCLAADMLAESLEDYATTQRSSYTFSSISSPTS